MASRLKAINHVGVVTRDLARLAAFSAGVFGAEETGRSANDRRAGPGFIPIGEATVLHVFERPDGPLGGITDDEAGRSFRQGRIDHVALEAIDVAAFAAARDRLVALGASDGAVTDFGPLVGLFFTDPDGFLLELSLRKPPDWDPPFAVSSFAPRAPR